MPAINRRAFISRSSLSAGSVLTAPLLPSFDNKPGGWQCIHNTNSMQTLVSMSGIRKKVRVLQVADTHISCDNESDKAFEQYSARMNNAFIQPKHYKTGQPSTTTENFKELMLLAKTEKVDMIALIGDIVNYPSATAVEFVRQQIQSTGIPHIYTAGNHDWHYEGMPGPADELRKEWCEKRLKPLYSSNNVLYSSNIVSGINMVTIDNSTYQVNDEQLAFYKQQIKKEEPVVLFVHIPLYFTSMRMSCGHPAWGAETDKNFEIERREKWPASGNNPSTTAFIKAVQNTPKLAGIFAGHWHQYFSVTQQHVTQHLALPGFNGQYRLIEFQPISVV